MMIAALIPLEWAIFFTQVIGLVALFLIIRKVVFMISERFFGKDD